MEVDVAILGGGVAGCATALALRRRGVERIVVVEAGRYEGTRIGESVPPDIRVPLWALGLGEDFEAQEHHRCLGSCSSWGSGELGYNDFVLNPYGSGWHLDRARFDRWLAARVEDAGIELRRSTRFLGVEVDGEHQRLRLSDGDSLEARFVVDATGGGARYGHRRGARRLEHDELLYLACGYDGLEASRLTGLTMLEAVSYGWWYAARLPDGRATVAVAADPEYVRMHGLTDPVAWLRALRQTRHVGEILGDREPVDPRPTGRIARSCLLGPPAGDGWLAVGDAAASYDPISAQGIIKGLDTGLRAASTIQRWLGGERDAVSEYAVQVISAFRAYLQQRDLLYGAERRWEDAPFWARRRRRRNLVAPEPGPAPRRVTRR